MPQSSPFIIPSDRGTLYLAIEGADCVRVAGVEVDLGEGAVAVRASYSWSEEDGWATDAFTTANSMQGPTIDEEDEGELSMVEIDTLDALVIPRLQMMEPVFAAARQLTS